jgi:hypothetical protein
VIAAGAAATATLVCAATTATAATLIATAAASLRDGKAAGERKDCDGHE